MFDPERLLGSIVGQVLGGAFGGRRGRRHSMFSTGDLAGKATLGLGALGIAMAAYQHYKGNQDAAMPQSAIDLPPSLPAAPTAPIPTPVAPRLGDSGVLPPPPPPVLDLATLSPQAAEAVLLVRAMIAAAGADELIDPDERARILARTADAGVDPQARQFLEAELAVPRSADEIGAMTPPALVNEVYAAAVLALDVDQESERRFLARLGSALGLSEQAQQEIRAQLA